MQTQVLLPLEQEVPSLYEKALQLLLEFPKPQLFYLNDKGKKLLQKGGKS